jgi:hypothetical protein
MKGKSEAEILDDLSELKEDVIFRTYGLLSGTNEEDDNMYQIVGSALLEAYIKGRNDGSLVIIENMDDIRKAIEEKVLEEYSGDHN